MFEKDGAWEGAVECWAGREKFRNQEECPRQTKGSGRQVKLGVLMLVFITCQWHRMVDCAGVDIKSFWLGLFEYKTMQHMVFPPAVLRSLVRCQASLTVWRFHIQPNKQTYRLSFPLVLCSVSH